MKVNVLVEVDKEMLKNAYSDDGEEASFRDAFEAEFGWLEQSGIYLRDWKVQEENK